VGPTKNKLHKHPLEGLMGLIGINLTYKSSYLDKKRLIKGLLVGLVISLSSQNTPKKDDDNCNIQREDDDNWPHIFFRRMLCIEIG
jgi:hypothetical protein